MDTPESLKTERLHESMAEAIRVFGDPDKAESWMSHPIVSLGGRRPIDCLDEVDGYERVRETLAKIEYGMY